MAQGTADTAALQQAAADLLSFLCFKSSAISEQLVQAGGLTFLQQLLPEAPAWQDPALLAGEAAAVQQSISASGAAAPEKLVASKVSATSLPPPLAYLVAAAAASHCWGEVQTLGGT